jgi:2-oxoglutarate dehydrogenase complex dehydrogenase (E1) component-like enzyme
MSEREKRGVSNVAFIRLERLCPFPVGELQQALSKYKKAKRELIL